MVVADVCNHANCIIVRNLLEPGLKIGLYQLGSGPYRGLDQVGIVRGGIEGGDNSGVMVCSSAVTKVPISLDTSWLGTSGTCMKGRRLIGVVAVNPRLSLASLGMARTNEARIIA